MKMHTPSEIREMLRCSEEKVYGWIQDGSLRAVNLAGKNASKARYRIEESALRDFLNLKQVVPPPKPAPRRKKIKVKQYV